LWGGLKAGCREFINDAITGINVLCNGILLPFNAMISLLDKIPGVKIPNISVSIPKVQPFASGGVITSPTLGLVGEAGAEAVMPLENNTGWMDKLANSISSRISSAGGGDTNLQLNVKVGESTLINTVINGINKQQRAAGKTLITV